MKHRVVEIPRVRVLVLVLVLLLVVVLLLPSSGVVFCDGAGLGPVYRVLATGPSWALWLVFSTVIWLSFLPLAVEGDAGPRQSWQVARRRCGRRP